MSGLPGTGKSAVAEVLVRAILAPLFSRDLIEAAIVRSHLEFPTKTSEKPTLVGVGYEIMTVLAARQLELGQSAVLDSVAGRRVVRSRWKELAERHGASWCAIECVCTDTALHRSRIEGRTRAIPGWYELSWADVERSARAFEPWDDERLVLDAVKPLQYNVAAALRYLRARN